MRRVEEEARLQERRQQEQAEREAAARREAEAAQARERARQEAEDKANLDRETERILRERAEAAQAAAARELAAREEMERRRLDHENATRERERLEREIYEQEFNRKREEEEAARRQKEREEKLDYDIESRHRQLRERERDIVEPEEHSWKTPAVAAAAGIAAGAAVAGIAHSSKDNPFDDKHAHGDSRSSKIEYDDDHLYEDEIMDPNYFNKKDSSRTPSREREQGIARNAAKKVIEDMEKRYKDDRKQSAAEFFAPPELLDRSTPSKIDYGPDADVQVYHSPYVVTVQPPYDPQYSFTATKDGYDHKINKFGGVPTLNLIEPTPPVSLAGSTRDEHSRSPSPAIPSHTDDSGSPTSTRASERDKEREREEKQRKRTSVTWGADETFHYEAQTPESFREHYMSEHDMKRHLPDDWVLQGNQSYTDQHSYQGNDEIVVERDSPRSGKERVSYRPEPEERNRGWGPETESPVEEIKRFEDDGRQVIDSTSPEHTPTIVTPSEEQAKPYHSPFFESVSDFQAYDVSPGAEAERQRGQRGYVEGEIVDEPEEIVLSKPRETEPHMPGGWDDDEPQREAESAWAEPKLSKKEQKKREKASKRASLDAQAEAARLAEDVASSTGSLRDLDKEARREPEPKVEEPAWEPPLTKKEKKKREKEAARRASLEAEAAAVAGVELPREEPVVQPEAEWEPPLSKKEQKKRDKAAKRASLDRQDSSSLPSTPAEEPKAEDLWEDAPSSKKDKKKKKRDSVDRDPRDIEPSFAYPSPPGEKDRESSRDAKSDYGVPPSRMPDVSDDKSRRRSMDAGNHSSSAVPLSFAAAAGILAGGLSDSKRKEPEVDPLYAATSPSHQMPRAPSPPSTSAPYPDYSNGHHASGAPYPPAWPSTYSQAESPARSIPSTAFHDYDELADAKQPSKKSKRRSRLGTGSAGPGSPLRTELAFDDYIGMDAAAAAAAATAGRGLSKTSSESFDAANVPLPENESPPFSPSGDKSSKGKKHYVYDEPEEFPISTGIDLPTDPYGPPYPRDEARHSPDQEEDRSKYYPERGYAWEEEGESYDADGHRKHKHRKHRSTGDDDTRSVVSEFRDDEEDERRKHKHRRSKRESEIFDDSLRDRDARSEPGDILDREDPEKRKHKRRSKREGDFDDTASVVSSPAKYYEDDKKKDKEKERKGIFSSIFGKSKESLVDTSSSKSHDNERQTGEETQQ
ncbi:Involucrin repeat protein [Neofusicoccum parvum]|uniref:Involucrin repeat protein n=1 Tax=Neofusicoccum parvum TaxID=310453 RepID=A0ACB5SIU4_9PEZI|nr:Involucrin repeat protein [Neofusicoccum parvum]